LSESVVRVIVGGTFAIANFAGLDIGNDRKDVNNAVVDSAYNHGFEEDARRSARRAHHRQRTSRVLMYMCRVPATLCRWTGPARRSRCSSTS